ncbi:hypothetical protein BGW38_001325 [Lunasporangiospora selenospora]|uniref:SH3 domain-containing protein n=1 Tax=Lunasporangiospora selenospora TaxID=979761 RepID=A0A9P6KE73_9FUNG|nr:hypothetical protein BGW38_001325 [Lunasporangiospora selenospora]
MCQHCSSPAGAADECCKSAAAVACPKPVTSSVSAAGSPSSSTTGTVSPTTTPIAEKANDSPIPGLSMAAFGGIIAGGVVLILLFFALIVCCMRRGRHNKTGASHPGGAKGVSRQMSSGSGRYNISAPKMQEEGFASSNMMNNSAPIPMTALPMNNAAHTGPVTTAGAVAAASVVADQDRKNSMIDDAPPNGKKFCQALYPYQASMADELELTPGDIVNVHRIFDDGWAVGMNMNTSNEGAFPIVCVTFVEESALDDDFEDVNMHAMAPMTHREDDSGRQSPRSSLPSRASSPVHLPRRHSSMLRDSAILPLGNLSSPLASSPLAGHNANGGHHNNNLAPPAMRDTMLSDASSINRWWDGEGSKQQ